MSNPSTILLVEDEAVIRDMLRMSLESRGYQLMEAADVQQARLAMAAQLPDLIIVDWMLPDLPGPDFIRALRADHSTRDVPILLLTARAEEQDMVRGLDAGADDYLSKPVSLKTLHARIHALLRRANGFNEQATLQQGRLTLNLANHQLHIDNTAVHIGSTEFRLLAFLMKRPDKTFSRSQLLDHVWGNDSYIDDRTVDVHILRLRKVLKTHQADHHIKTVRGAGYLFASLESKH